MSENGKNLVENFTKQYSEICKNNSAIDRSLYKEYGVKRGLRDENGKGVLAGLTNISAVLATKEVDGQTVPSDGRLYYRGYSINDLVDGFVKDNRFGFEEMTYLLLFSKLPTEEELKKFKEVLNECMDLPRNFVRDVVMKGPSKDIMNSLAKSVLTLASYDKKVDDLSLDNVLAQCLRLISVFPRLSVYAYQAYRHFICDDSLYIHRPDENLSTAENILRMLRPDKQFTELEAKVLDVALVLHMEHGGGNNSTFTTRVVSSSGSDTYSVMAAALSSLKGPKHGGANRKVMEMIDDIKENISDIKDEEEIRAYLTKILNKEAFDKSGLIYGIGHAVYSVSDPRAVVFKSYVEKLASEKDREDEFKLYSTIERLAPELISQKRKMYKGVSANVDFYSGFVYSMLGIPQELYTPLFAMARIVGWSAHRLEELITGDKIIRPAYRAIAPEREYLPINER